MTRYVTAEEAADQLQRRLAELAPDWVVAIPDLQQRLVSALADEPQQLLTTMSFEAYLAWLDEDRFAEWEDGKVVLMSPASLRHQLILSFLLMLLGQYVQRRQAGIVVPAPFPMQLPQIRRGREPDLIFVANANLARLTDTHLKGPADLVMEIISPESQTRDRITEFYEYAAAGIPEYWIIDPITQTLEVYWLDAAGNYRLIAADDTGCVHSLVLPGFWLQPAWLWEEPLSSVERRLVELDAD
jgi:Uma2 family endonuclease